MKSKHRQTRAVLVNLALVVISSVVAILGAVLLRTSKLSVFTVTLLANLLTIPATLIAFTYTSGGISSWLILLMWLVAWLVESIFLGLCLRGEIGFGKAFGLALAMNLASFAVGVFLPAGIGFGL